MVLAAKVQIEMKNEERRMKNFRKGNKVSLGNSSFFVLHSSSNEVYVVLAARLSHAFGPDAGLYFADVGLAQVEHAEA